MAATTTLEPTHTTHETTTRAATTTESPKTKPTSSESTTMEHTTPGSTVPNTSTNKPTTPKSTTVESTTTEATTPKTKPTSSESTTMEHTTPGSTVPDTSTHKTTTPKSTTAESTTTEATTPEATTSAATTSEATTSEATTPEATTPEATTQEATTPQFTTPEVTTPENTTPEATTSEVTTTQVTTPEPTTPVPAIIQTFGILDKENKTYCIVLEGKLEFEIPYMTKDGKVIKARIPLPINTTVSGSCKYNGLDTAQQIILSFFDDWSFSVIINQSQTVSFGRRRLLAETVTYDWNAISLNYVIDDNFPNAQDIGKRFQDFSKPNFAEFKSKQDGSYKCDADQRIDIGDQNITLVLSNFQYTAFAKQVDKTFENEGVTECGADKKDDDDHVGAIVGGVVGGTVGLIIIIGIVLYCRNRRRKDYVVM
ncbi:hypothetical protein DPMN_139399 [Dreissena polymorpha]|uniref:Lysosome-associated membrane glycoprotein 1 n=2 Tax=Dreissena polymorpha TaxID=45954 RepID=A0A9D4G5N4_DREPO|nr:hypothetical protein DPMN_139399 [Dreissena polymorpha]